MSIAAQEQTQRCNTTAATGFGDIQDPVDNQMCNPA